MNKNIISTFDPEFTMNIPYHEPLPGGSYISSIEKVELIEYDSLSGRCIFKRTKINTDSSPCNVNINLIEYR